MMKQETQPSEKPHKVRNSLNYTPGKGKKFTKKSLTVPDQSIPLKVLLERTAKGMPLGAAMRIPLYEETPSNGIHPATLDPAEVEEFMNQTEKEVNNYANEKREQQKQLQARKQQELFDKQVAEELDRRSKLQQDGSRGKE